jgi:hypothetical protein
MSENSLTNFLSNPSLSAYDKTLAIIVPYRNRSEHLSQFLPHMITYFQRDKLDKHISYSIHIVEQFGDKKFNRGKINNCGFSITQNQADYFCFHDVDYLPIWADYSYCKRPVRLIWYGLVLKEDYENFFGAVVMFNKHDFLKTNGYSNNYWGWGNEDTELGIRCRMVGISFDKRDGTFMALPHKHEGFNADGTWTEEAFETYELLQERLITLNSTFLNDGLSSLNFDIVQSENISINGTMYKNIFHHKVLI